MPEPKALSHRERRCLFTRLLAELITWITQQPDWEVAIDEATVHSPRWVWHDRKRLNVDDAVHAAGSYHHVGLAADLNLYIDGKYISNGDHPAWREIARRWESLHPECVSGRRFHDANHVSFGGEAARTEPLP